MLTLSDTTVASIKSVGTVAKKTDYGTIIFAPISTVEGLDAEVKATYPTNELPYIIAVVQGDYVSAYLERSEEDCEDVAEEIAYNLFEASQAQ